MTSVLIIDDHPLIMRECRRLLESAGIVSVLCAENLSSGYALYRNSYPDVVVLDLSLGDDPLEGLSFVRRVKAEGSQTRVVIFSMHDDPAIVDHCLKAGAADYIVKDACPGELVRVVRGSVEPGVSPVHGSRVGTVVGRPPCTE